jgi:hypothetical protein
MAVASIIISLNRTTKHGCPFSAMDFWKTISIKERKEGIYQILTTNESTL